MNPDSSTPTRTPELADSTNRFGPACVGLAAFFLASFVASGQPVTLGQFGPRGAGDFGPQVTVVDMSAPATTEGVVRSAIFAWSNAPCLAAAKIKIFQPNAHTYQHWSFDVVAEWGPFDVVRPTQKVRLDPPFDVRPDYVVGISSVTPCGGPVKSNAGFATVLQADVSSFAVWTALPWFSPPSVLIEATSTDPDLFRKPRVVPFR